jgi:hypothetical protein
LAKLVIPTAGQHHFAWAFFGAAALFLAALLWVVVLVVLTFFTAGKKEI